jgi:hypothetical protein
MDSPQTMADVGSLFARQRKAAEGVIPPRRLLVLRWLSLSRR